MTNRPTYAEISLSNLTYNFNSVKQFIGEGLSYMAVVKANAYGHGLVECSKALEKAGVDFFGVAIPEEGIQLRAAGIKNPIVSLGGFWEGQENLLLENRISPVVFQIASAERLNRAAFNKNLTVDIHLKIDTGMGRLGIRFDEIKDFSEKLRAYKNLNVHGVMTHLAAADDLQENNFTNVQIKRFYEAVSIVEAKEFKPVYKDLANSPGAIAHSNSRGNLVRLGGILYGLEKDVLPADIKKPLIKPVMSIYSRISNLKKVLKGETLGYGRTFMTTRDSLIATIPIGYHDGYMRGLSNKGFVIIKESLAPVVGRISMDWTVVDVTDISDIKINEEVILLGSRGNLVVSAEELAHKTNTISYEFTCGINSRVKRIYK